MAGVSQVDDRQFRASIAELAKISGRTYLDTFKLAGAGPIIKALAKDKAAKPVPVKRIRRAVANRYHRQFTGSAGTVRVARDGKTFFRRSGSTTWRLVFSMGPSRGWHLGPSEWAAYQSVVKQRAKAIIEETRRISERRGLLRMSFIQIADRLGIDLAKVSGGAVSEAIPRRAQMPGRLGQGNATASGAQFKMVMANFSTGVTGKNAAYWNTRLQVAINSRATAIQIDMQKGVFKDMKTRAKRYPGLFVK